MRVQLKPQRRNPDRTSVFIDGKYAFSVDKETLKRMGYFTEAEISEDELDKLLYETERTQARNYAFRLLSYRMRTSKEIKERLMKRKYSEIVIQDVLAELNSLGLIDDEKFAENFVRDRLNFALKGKQMIFAELIKKGINEEVIKNALKSISDQQEESACLKLIRKYEPRYRNLAKIKRQQRIYSLLNRRGFSYATIKKVLKLNEEN
ncbi:MAG: RecX family transcriptional regulator [candidate division WOR-3 bacterium]